MSDRSGAAADSVDRRLGLGLLGLGVWVVSTELWLGPQYSHGHPTRVVQLVSLLVAALLMVVRWFRRWRWISVAMVVCTWLVPGIYGGNFGVLLAIPLAFTLLAIDLGTRQARLVALGGVGLVLALTILDLVQMAKGQAPGRTLLDELGSTVANVGALLAGLLTATMVQRVDALRRRNATLAQERAEVIDELSDANQLLMDRLETQRDLVLAEERARAAQDMHDGLGRSLTLLGMRLDLAAASATDEPTRDAIIEARAMVRDSLSEMRTWVRALHPVSRPGTQGRESLDAIAESFRGTGLQVDVDARGQERPMSAETSLYVTRFVQEGLTNALRHGRPSSVTLVLDQQDPTWDIVELVDDGSAVRGSTHNPVTGSPSAGVPAGVGQAQREGFGLRSLRERAQTLGGTIEAAPRVDRDHGFRLATRLPRS